MVALGCNEGAITESVKACFAEWMVNTLSVTVQIMHLGVVVRAKVLLFKVLYSFLNHLDTAITLGSTLDLDMFSPSTIFQYYQTLRAFGSLVKSHAICAHVGQGAV